MPKASLTLANGTIVTIEGTAPEVQELLSLYGSPASKAIGGRPRNQLNQLATEKPVSPSGDAVGTEVDLMAIVNLVKSCDDAENIGVCILDQADQLARVLLPMYIVYEHLGNSHGLTSGQISKVTVQLGVPVKLSNVSKILSGSAAKYIIGDTVRKNGQAVRYKLSRRGHTYMREVIAGHDGR